MKISRKKLIIMVVSSALAAVLFTSCTSKTTSAVKSPSSSTSQSGTELASSLGIKKPEAFGLKQIKAGSGLNVYGSGHVKANGREFKAEIDAEDLTKIKAGYKVSISNAEKGIICDGTVKNLPDKTSIAGKSTCEIDILLDDNPSAAASQQNSTKKPATTQTQNGTTTTQTSSSAEGLPTVDADVTVKVHLPASPNAIYINNAAIFKGSNGKSYVWVSSKNITEVTDKDLKLTEVTTGKTDGKVTEITEGLKDGDVFLIGA